LIGSADPLPFTVPCGTLYATFEPEFNDYAMPIFNRGSLILMRIYQRITKAPITKITLFFG